MVDFLNVDEVTKALNTSEPPEGGLNRLELFLSASGFAEAKERIEPLRVIQNLRSAGMAHGKGDRYAAALKRGGLEALPLVDASMKVFQGGVDFIEWVRTDVLKIEDTGPPPLES